MAAFAAYFRGFRRPRLWHSCTFRHENARRVAVNCATNCATGGHVIVSCHRAAELTIGELWTRDCEEALHLPGAEQFEHADALSASVDWRDPESSDELGRVGSSGDNAAME